MGVLAAAFAGDDCKDHVHACLVAGQGLAACSPVCPWFSPISYYSGVLGYHLSSLPFCKNFLFEITAETKKLWESWHRFYFSSFRCMSSYGICACPVLNWKYPLRVISPGTNWGRTKVTYVIWISGSSLSSSGAVFRVDEDLSSYFQGTKSFWAQPNPDKDFTRCLEFATDQSHLETLSWVYYFWWISKEHHKWSVLEPNRPLGGNWGSKRYNNSGNTF